MTVVVPPEMTEDVRQAVVDTGRSYVEAKHVIPNVEHGQSNTGRAMKVLEELGKLETWSERSSGNLYMVKDGIEEPAEGTGRPWHDRDLLEELRCERGLTAQEMAAELGCSQSTTKKWMKRYGIDYGHKRHGDLYLTSTRNGQSAVVHRRERGEEDVVRIHKLCAVAWFGEYPETVKYKNGEPWDLREENLRLANQEDRMLGARGLATDGGRDE